MCNNHEAECLVLATLWKPLQSPGHSSDTRPWWKLPKTHASLWCWPPEITCQIVLPLWTTVDSITKTAVQWHIDRNVKIVLVTCHEMTWNLKATFPVKKTVLSWVRCLSSAVALARSNYITNPINESNVTSEVNDMPIVMLISAEASNSTAKFWPWLWLWRPFLMWNLSHDLGFRGILEISSLCGIRNLCFMLYAATLCFVVDVWFVTVGDGNIGLERE